MFPLGSGAFVYVNSKKANPVAASRASQISEAVAKPKTKGFPEWTEEELDQYAAHWPLGTRERVMWGVFCFTGLRRGDAAKLGKQHIRNGVITIDTEKTGTRVRLSRLSDAWSWGRRTDWQAEWELSARHAHK